MKRIAIISAIIFCALQLSCIAAEEQQNTQDSTDINNEIEDFVQYYRDLNKNSGKPQSEKNDIEFRQSLLEDDLIPRQSTLTGSSQKNKDIAKNQGNANGPVKGALYSQSEEKKDFHDAHTGVKTNNTFTGPKPQDLWQGSQPLYQGNNPNTQNQNILAGTQAAHVLTPTMYRPKVYTSGGQSN